MKKTAQDIKRLIQFAAEDLYAAITFNSDYSITLDYLSGWSHGNLITALKTATSKAIDRIQVSVTTDGRYSTNMDGHIATDLDLSLSLFRQLQYLLESGQIRATFLTGIDSRLLDLDNPGYGYPLGLEEDCDDSSCVPF